MAQIPVNIDLPGLVSCSFMDEAWFQIPGWEGLYDVSSLIRVRNSRTGKILKSCLSKQGYLVFYFYRNGKKKVRKLHQIVAEVFIGQCPSGQVVRHKDDDKLNCWPDNLEYGTQADNLRDTVRNGNHHWTNVTHCPAGHEYTEENTYIDGKGSRNCRQCNNEKSQQRYWDDVEASRKKMREYMRERRARTRADGKAALWLQSQ